MKKFRFFDTALKKEILIERATISEAILASLEMVLDGVAQHPMYIGEVK